jgi:tRNA(fMet)-specific endonuclease VapC
VGGRFLLDTSIVVEFFTGNLRVARAMADAEQVFVPVIAIGELLMGAQRSARREESLKQVRDLTAATATLPCDEETAWAYGLIKNELRAKGRPIPENDVWIAALARQHGLVLATRDAHFNEIDDFPVVSWTS